MVLPIFPMIWVNHRKKHQWYSHIIWKLLVLSTSRLACNSFMACILHMYRYDWASMRKPWHVLNNVCNKMFSQVLVAFSKSSSSTFLATAVTCDTQYHRDSAKTARPTLQRCLQESPPWKYEHGLNTAFFTEWCALAEWLVSNISNGFYVLPQVDTITYTARHVPSQMKHSKSPVRDLKKVENWFCPLAI